MRVIGLAVVLAISLLLAPLAGPGEPQQATKIPRIGLLDYAEFWDPLRQELSRLGYLEGKTIAFDYHPSAGHVDRLPELARDLVQRHVDLIVTYGTPATQVAKQATNTIPIVMVGVGEPVRTGLVASLARPAANITGSTILGADLGPKRLELLHEAIPGVSRVLFFGDPRNASSMVQLEHIQMGARTLGLTVLSVQAHGVDEFDSDFAEILKKRPDALMVTADAVHQLFVARIVQFAASHRLPTIYQVKENVLGGGLMSYGPNLPEMFRRTAFYVDKILKGAKPADLPVEQPTRFELVINLKTAKALGLTIPQSVLGRADEVVQ
jgi:putative tryptophan/tyrosine transport system substrate-binding protein